MSSWTQNKYMECRNYTKKSHPIGMALHRAESDQACRSLSQLGKAFALILETIPIAANKVTMEEPP